jgi:hypothetical protein
MITENVATPNTPYSAFRIHTVTTSARQGNRGGQIFADWANANFGYFLKMAKKFVRTHFGRFLGRFFGGEFLGNFFGKKMDSAAFWANFSQTHLVTLLPGNGTLSPCTYSCQKSQKCNKSNGHSSKSYPSRMLLNFNAGLPDG